MTEEELRSRAMDELDHPEEFEAAAEVVAEALLEGRSAEVVLAPGNMTRYVYLFVPMEHVALYTSPFEHAESNAGYGEGSVWVVRLGGGKPATYGLCMVGRQRAVPHCSYIAEKWFEGKACVDVFILEALLAAIIDRVGEREPA